jgi:hypothetical protein
MMPTFPRLICQAEHPWVAVSREQVVAHLAYLQRDCDEVPEPGFALISLYELPPRAPH